MQTFISADRRRMYGDLAWIWPIISPPEEYVEETEEYIRLIKEHARIPVGKVLNLGCGGGHNDYTLARYFDVTGVDISPDMLALARELNPQVTYVSGDMRSVRLGQGFDAVTVFDSITYMRTAESLKAAFLTAFSHLRPGGVFVTTVEESKETFVQNHTRHLTRKRGEVEITLVENDYDPNPDDTCIEANFIYLIRRRGELTLETDCHLLGLFEMKTWIDTMMAAGLEVFTRKSETADPEGRFFPIVIGLKPVAHTHD